MVINEALQNFAYLSQPADECGLKSPPKNKNSNLLRFLRLSQKQIAIQNLHNLTYFCWSRTIPRRIMLRGVSRRRIFYHQFQICFLVDLILTSIQSGEVIPPVAFIAKGPRPPYPIFDSLLVRDDSDNVAFLIPLRRKSRVFGLINVVPISFFKFTLLLRVDLDLFLRIDCICPSSVMWLTCSSCKVLIWKVSLGKYCLWLQNGSFCLRFLIRLDLVTLAPPIHRTLWQFTCVGVISRDSQPMLVMILL
jgi:hypothetical protein